MSNLTTFYLIRHGETDWNNKNILQGHTDIPLNEVGERQAKELAKTLNHIDFDLAFSSDLVRAKRTAEIILLEKKLAVEVTKVLRERNFGKLEGGPTDALHAQFALLKGLTPLERSQHRIDTDVETDEEVTTRLITFMRETAVTHPGKTILVGTHGGVLRTLLIHFGSLTYEQSDNSFVLNGAYIKVESDGVDFFVKEISGVKPKKPVA